VRQTNANHLSYEDKTNLGSFYTPKHIVDKTYKMLNKFCPSGTILDPSCGGGAFFDADISGYKKILGADIDKKAIAIAKKQYPKHTFFVQNALVNVSRKNYNIGDNEKLIIVGNPPYNDATSHVKYKIKTKQIVDDDIAARDLGLSSILAYDKLKADYIAILHPLSYLIKKTNFNKLAKFTKNYQLKDSLVFNSQEFFDTSKKIGFPIIIAIYERNTDGIKYSDIENWIFRTLEGSTFSLSKFDYISNYISKYPNKCKENSSDDILFYTMRDINALKRSRTFISKDTPNAIHIDKNKIDYYYYVDVFKHYADPPYYMGNLDIPINNDDFIKNIKSFRKLSIAMNNNIFKKKPANSLAEAEQNVQNYFNKLLN
jgi:hypothetical protein